MHSCLWRSKSRDQRSLGSPLPTFLEPKARGVSLCDSLHGRLPRPLDASAQFEHSFHHARFGQSPIG